MKLTDQLHALAAQHPDLAHTLLDAADRIEFAHRWRDAWHQAEQEKKNLTLRIEVLELRLDHRKEKADHEENCND